MVRESHFVPQISWVTAMSFVILGVDGSEFEFQDDVSANEVPLRSAFTCAREYPFCRL